MISATIGLLLFADKAPESTSDADGIGFAAYWLTGRSEASRSRRMVVGPDELEIVDTTAGPADPLRHYVAIMRTGGDRIVVGNGTQVGEVVTNVAAGAAIWEALTGLECEPDPPILTPRITATAIVDGSQVREVIASGAVVTSGQPVAVEVDASWPQLLERVWAGLDPELRVAAAVVPLIGDLRAGRFIGVHAPMLLQPGTDRATM